MDFSLFFDQSTQELWGGYDLQSANPSHWHYGRQYMSEIRITHYVTAALNCDNKTAILERLLDKNGQIPSATFGGSLFEQLAPTLLVTEPQFISSHQREINRHMQHSHPDGWWGLSPCDHPDTGHYQEFGLGGFYKTEPIITPYAPYLALNFEPLATRQMLKRLENQYDIYNHTGYKDSVSLATGKVANSQLALDQIIILLSLTNYLKDNYFPKLFAPFIPD